MTASHQLKGSNGAAPVFAGNSHLTALLSVDNKNARSNKALIEGEDYRLSYRELLDSVCRMGSFFEERRLAIGDRAVLISDDDPSTITLFFALIRHGFTATILNPNSSASELEALTEAADPAVIFADTAVVGRVDCLQNRQEVVTINPEGIWLRARGIFKRKLPKGNATSFPAMLSHYSPLPDLPDEIPADTPAYILFTSGTTSRPKGVVITHRNLFSQMNTFINQYGFDSDSRLLNVLPFYHTDGLTQGAVVAFAAGATLLRPMRFRIERVAELMDSIYRLRVTHLITVPSILALVEQLSDQSSDAFQTHEFKFVISTAAYLDEALWRRFEETFGVRVVNVYGLTETVCEACYCGPDEESFAYGTVGKPVDCEARILTEDGSLAACGGPGELALKGDNIMAGYFRMPEETAEVLRDGWFYTGDIAEIDERGFVRIVGRKKSVIISGGVNIYPEDVTNVIRRMPGVLDAVTFGLPDPTWGEKVISCIIPLDGFTLTESDAAAHFLAEASREKLPREFHFLSEFPRGPAGKVIVDALIAEIESARESRSPNIDDSSSIREQFLTITAKAFKIDVDAVTLESTPEQVESWDSLAHVEWLMALEHAYSIRFDPRDIMTIKSVGQALTALEVKQH